MERSSAKIICLLLGLSLAACATPSRQPLYDRLNAGMSYDEALQLWGTPTTVAQGETIFVATWMVSENSGATAFQIPNSPLPTAMIFNDNSGWRLDLTFDKSTNQLTYWRYKEW